MSATLTPTTAATILLQRRSIRSSLVEWARYNGYEPALHHQLIISHLEDVVKGRIKKLMVCTPPNTAKSTYISKLFPPWFLAQTPNKTILACSYSKDLIVGFGRTARNLVETHHSVLGYSLRTDSSAADEWETSSGGRYYCAGVGAGLSGHRADLGVIDDPIGSEEDAGSKIYRDKLYNWYRNDFVPRLNPGAPVVIIANRRHEEDLCGRLLAEEGSEWTVLKFVLVIDTPAQQATDPLHRALGERMWPERFTPETVIEARRSNAFSGLHQQEPTPESGDVFKAEWLQGYSPSQLPKDLAIYVGSDHALSKRESADSHCIVLGGLDSNHNLYILPDLWWQKANSGEMVAKMLDTMQRYHPTYWFAEKDHIETAVMPFLRQQMIERHLFVPWQEIPPGRRDLRRRCAPIIGMMSLSKVFFPKFATWWAAAEHQLLSFDKGSHDDFVAGLSALGQGLDKMYPAKPAKIIVNVEPPTTFIPTFSWLKTTCHRQSRSLLPAIRDN